MRHIQTDILVIGGGATGTGILRDLVMRGFDCLLVERRDLAYGTTGRYHGLLHSGARYVVKDPLAARECIEENRILRRIMPQCIEDTGGFFVLTAMDDPAYIPLFVNGCQQAGIPAEQVDIAQMLRQEPWLDPHIQQCFQVPDASADSFLAADLNAESARQHGAKVLTYHEIRSLSTRSATSGQVSTVTGALCHDLVKDEDVQVDASVVINASGAWAGKIANLAGIRLQMLPGKGTMVAVNHRVVNTVINRCKLPSDGDILVPAHSVAVMGTTDIRVTDPDHYGIEPWEIRLTLDEGEKIIPGFKEFRILRAWAGVRPLIQEASTASDRDVSRAFTLLDHAQRDGIEGFITITSGKWTTYRKMAQVTVDKVCEKLHIDRQCRTHLEALPSLGEQDHHLHYLGARLQKIEQEASYGQLVCECELVTQAEVARSIVQSDAQTIDDVRRDVRLGMGPCQGAFCAFRATGMLHALRHPPVEKTNLSLRDFLQERWKGDLPVLWGQQLRQERFNELVYIDVLNAPNLPGGKGSNLAPEPYANPSEQTGQIPPGKPASQRMQGADCHFGHPLDLIVIGAGLAGLVTGWRASLNGLKTTVITKGWGVIYWGSGCIDLAGYQAPDYSKKVDSPRDYLGSFIKTHPDHPYAKVGLDDLEQTVKSFLQLCHAGGYPFHGSPDRNYMLPTALGTLRPTCLAPMTMVAGEAGLATPMLIVGFSQFLDFHPSLVADNLNVQGILARDISLDLKSLKTLKYVTGMVLARLVDNVEFRQEIIDALKPRLGSAGRVGFPAVLGLHHCAEAIKHLEVSLGVPVFEIPGLPPSIPGLRLHNLMVSSIQGQGGFVYNGMAAYAGRIEDHKVTGVWSEAASRGILHRANNFVLATGGILGGGVITRENGYAQDAIFNLPIDTPKARSAWFQEGFLSPGSHPIHSTGIQVDRHFHPVDASGQVIYQNLSAVGSVLGNCDPIRERSLEGIALATGFKLGEHLSASGAQ